jgi:ABC-2 type transport system permease protein
MAEFALSMETQLAPWSPFRESVRSAFLLGAREVRTAFRTPAYLLPNLIVPIFFYFVMIGSLETFAGNSGIDNWEAFQLPFAILFAAQGGSAGLNMVADIESGYFDKLLVTPANRMSILLGAMAADFLRVTVQATLVLLVAFAFGLDFATGVPGAVALIAISACWGLAYSGVGFAIALKTGNSQATQSMWFLFMPFLFLTTLYAPKEDLEGWLAAAATVNPVTYMLEGMRALSMNGWDAGDLAGAIAAVAGVGAITMTAAFLALRGRVQ